MSTWDDKWGPIIAERKARQDAGLKERVDAIDRGLAERDERLTVARPSAGGGDAPRTLGQRGVASLESNVDTKKDTLSVQDTTVSSVTDFNGSILICISGTPYWINIPYDATRGAYDGSDAPDFVIPAP